MLVLSRRCEEKIVFPSLGITVQILQIKGHQIKIGIDAPPTVTILREELSQGAFRERDDRPVEKAVPALKRKG